MDTTFDIHPDEVDILIVEDSPTQAERLRRLIQSRQYRARVAANGQLALAAIGERKPQLVLSDIVMPEMNGYELCRAIKADAALKDIPVILVTSFNDPKDIIHGIECGADNVIGKPYAEEYLFKRIGYMLMNQKLRRHHKEETGIALHLGQQKYSINAERPQILDLLISTYEQAVHVNGELKARERQVIELNTRLARHAVDLETIKRDIALKNLELAEASRLKSAFIANMSHELRTPLNAIIGFTGALLMKLPGPLTVEQGKQLNTVRGSAHHLLALINDILDVAKIEAGKVTLAPEPVLCQQLAVETADSLRPMAAQKALDLTLDLAPDAIVLDTDRRALTQIILNLLGNAIKFTERGAVRLTLSQHTDEEGFAVTEFAITDSGAGIRPQDQARLFQAFSQIDATSTRRAEGAGLGLYLSQNLAKLLGARLFFSSEFGIGSTFTLALRKRR